MSDRWRVKSLPTGVPSMNTRLFIGEVKKRKALWDHTNTNYHNRRMLTDGWRDIAKMFNTEVIAVKQKWKNLRDTFRVELKKTKRYSNTDSSLRSLWAYYDDMYFLKDILKTRRLTEGDDGADNSEGLADVKVEPDSEITFSPNPLADDNDTNHGIVIENVTSLRPQSEEVNTTQEQKSRRGAKRKRSHDGDNADSDEEQDDDLLFFRSLLPFTRKLDQDKKLLFRMNVQQMLYNQLYN
ncbi:hypothetical protein MTP99_015560 [Tenebrio molitor]|nr:hypothetical protein MTP99_015560 [Tenebrio molitor]